MNPIMLAAYKTLPFASDDDFAKANRVRAKLKDVRITAEGFEILQQSGKVKPEVLAWIFFDQLVTDEDRLAAEPKYFAAYRNPVVPPRGDIASQALVYGPRGPWWLGLWEKSPIGLGGIPSKYYTRDDDPETKPFAKCVARIDESQPHRNELSGVLSATKIDGYKFDTRFSIPFETTERGEPVLDAAGMPRLIVKVQSIRNNGWALSASHSDIPHPLLVAVRDALMVAEKQPSRGEPYRPLLTRALAEANALVAVRDGALARAEIALAEEFGPEVAMQFARAEAVALTPSTEDAKPLPSDVGTWTAPSTTPNESAVRAPDFDERRMVNHYFAKMDPRWKGTTARLGSGYLVTEWRVADAQKAVTVLDPSGAKVIEISGRSKYANGACTVDIFADGTFAIVTPRRINYYDSTAHRVWTMSISGLLSDIGASSTRAFSISEVRGENTVRKNRDGSFNVQIDLPEGQRDLVVPPVDDPTMPRGVKFQRNPDDVFLGLAFSWR